jgi:hypothetical protein
MSAMAFTVTPPRQIEPPCWSAFVPLPSDAVHILKVVSQDIDETKYGGYKSATNPCGCRPDFQTRENFLFTYILYQTYASRMTPRENLQTWWNGLVGKSCIVLLLYSLTRLVILYISIFESSSRVLGPSKGLSHVGGNYSTVCATIHATSDTHSARANRSQLH